MEFEFTSQAVVTGSLAAITASLTTAVLAGGRPISPITLNAGTYAVVMAIPKYPKQFPKYVSVSVINDTPANVAAMTFNKNCAVLVSTIDVAAPTKVVAIVGNKIA